MSLLRKSLKGSFELSVGQALTYGCSFVRLAILARILDKADLGVAATFSITIVLLEMISNISLNRLVVQSKEGDSSSFQGMLHLLEASRGLLNAAVLFILAWPISHFFKIPEARWAFQSLAVVPLLRGFVHLDINRLEREMNFRPRIVAEVIPQILITAAVWPMAAWLKDYSALLWLLLAMAAFTLAASHLTAKRSYRWSWENSYLAEVLRFGWPLMLNGLLLYLVSQGDRLLVGNQYNMESLAVYTVAASLALTPGEVLRYINRSVMLPLLAGLQGLPLQFRKAYAQCGEVLTILSGLLTGSLVIMGEAVLVVVFSDKYASGGPLIIPFAIAGGLWIMRSGPTTAAMALGDTRTVMTATLVRSLGLALAAVAVIAGLPLVWIAWSAVLGEFLALSAAIRMLAVHDEETATRMFAKAALVWASIIVPILLIRATCCESGVLGSVLCAAFFCILWLVASCALFDHLRCHLLCAIKDLTQSQAAAPYGGARTVVKKGD